MKKNMNKKKKKLNNDDEFKITKKDEIFISNLESLIYIYFIHEVHLRIFSNK